MSRARRRAEMNYALAANAYMEYEEAVVDLAHSYYQARESLSPAAFRAKFENASAASDILEELFARLKITPDSAAEAAAVLEENPQVVFKDFVDPGSDPSVVAKRRAEQQMGGPQMPIYLPPRPASSFTGANFLTAKARDHVALNIKAGHDGTILAVPDQFLDPEDSSTLLPPVELASAPRGALPVSPTSSSLLGGTLLSFALCLFFLTKFSLLALGPLSGGTSLAPPANPQELFNDEMVVESSSGEPIATTSAPRALQCASPVPFLISYTYSPFYFYLAIDADDPDNDDLQMPDTLPTSRSPSPEVFPREDPEDPVDEEQVVMEEDPPA